MQPHANKPVIKQTDKRTYRKTDRHTHRQIDIQTFREYKSAITLNASNRSRVRVGKNMRAGYCDTNMSGYLTTGKI